MLSSVIVHLPSSCTALLMAPSCRMPGTSRCMHEVMSQKTACLSALVTGPVRTLCDFHSNRPRVHSATVGLTETCSPKRGPAASRAAPTLEYGTLQLQHSSNHDSPFSHLYRNPIRAATAAFSSSSAAASAASSHGAGDVGRVSVVHQL